jgi:hypothetical protein
MLDWSLKQRDMDNGKWKRQTLILEAMKMENSFPRDGIHQIDCGTKRFLDKKGSFNWVE